MTLNEMIKECSYRIDETIDTTSTNASVVLMINKLKSSINTCYKKLAREKLIFTTKETILLENNIFNTEYLLNKCYKVKRITDTEGHTLRYDVIGDNEIEVDTDLTSVIVYYYYIPKDLVNLADSTKFPKNIDDMILVNYASYDYLNMVGEAREMAKAQNELALYQDAYENIKIPAEIVRAGGYID